MKIRVKRYIAILCVVIIVLTGSTNVFAIGNDITTLFVDNVDNVEDIYIHKVNDITTENEKIIDYTDNNENRENELQDVTYDFVTFSDENNYSDSSIQLFASGVISYRQTDSKWASHSYGKGPGGAKATIKSSGCALLSLTNAVYHLTGKFINPTILADFSVKKGYRVNGVGTSHNFFKGASNEYGITYGFKYKKATSSISDLTEHLKNGGVATCVQPGHFMAITDYNTDTKKYLLLDSYPSSKRGTSSGYAWKTSSQLSSSLGITKYFLLSATTSQKPSKPTITSCGATSPTEIKLEWNKIPDVSKYKIVRTEVNSTNQKTFDNITDTKYTDTKLKSGTTYYYKVYAINSAGTSDASLVYKTYTKPSTPNQPKVHRDSSSQLTVSWDDISGATDYWVYRRKYNEDKSQKIATTKATSYTDTGLEAGTQYFYSIVAVRTGEIGLTDKHTTHSIKSEESPGKSHFTTGKHPSNDIDNNNPTHVILDWKDVKPKTKENFTYEIRRNGAAIKTGVNGTTYTDTTATQGEIYKYEIKTEGASWTTEEFYAAPKITDEISVTANDASSMRISWNKPRGVNDNLVYAIRRDGNEIGRTTDTYYIDSGLTAGNTYTYYIQVRDKDNHYITSTYEKSAALQPSDLGTGFYASIMTSQNWLPLKADTGNVCLGDTAGTADTLWRFDRDTDGSYKISSVVNGSVFDASGWGTDAGTNVGVYDAHDDETKTNQRWYLFEKNGGYVIIPSYNMGLALDVSGAVFSSGTNIQLWTRNDSGAQIYYLNRENNIQLKAPTLSVQTDSSNAKTKFYWNGVSGAVNYKLSIYQSGTLYKEETINGNEYSAELPAGSYSVVVQALNHFESANSNTVSFSFGCTSHTYGKWKIQSEASCMTDGVKYRECTNCGQTEMEVIPKSNHNYTDFVKDATCTEDGEKYQICQNCGDKVNIETIDALGHTFPDEWMLEKTATCTETGIESRICSVCGYKEERSTECADHDNELTGQTDPTLTGPGSRTYTCKTCGSSYTEEYVPLVEEGTIDVGGTAASAGQTMTIPVTIRDNPGIAGFNFVLDYDKTVMTPKEITKGSLITSGTFDTNLDEGLPVSELEDVAVSWSDSSNITEDGELFNITFEVNSNAPDGKYIVSLNYDKGDVTAQTYEDVMPDIHSNIIHIADVLKGDINLDGKINLLDSTLLAKVLAHYKIELSEKQKEAANVFNDKNKAINTKDAVSLAQIIAGWENPILEELSTINLFSEGDKPTIKVESFEASAGDYIDVPVTITENPGMSGFSFTLNYDKDKLTPIAIEKANILTDGNFESNLIENADSTELEYVTATWSDTDSLKEDGALFSVMFEVNENVEVGETLPIDINYEDGDICDKNLDSINAAVTQGKIDVIEFTEEEVEPDNLVDYVYFINDITMKNIDGTACEELPVNGDFDLEVGIESTAEEFTLATVLAATYDESGCLISLKSVNITEEMLTEGACNMHIDESSAAINKVNIFIWNSINGMIPLADTVII